MTYVVIVHGPHVDGLAVAHGVAGLWMVFTAWTARSMFRRGVQ